ncbi:MAG: hypothetical protein M9920_02865 [Verrucomicrobiae bacterium]|nr:hypothetical protein [Verrucomicrobiae bacterium]
MPKEQFRNFKANRQTFLGLLGTIGLLELLVFLWLLVPRVTAQPLPDAWWQQSSAEEVLARAKSITRDLTFFHGKKTGLLTDQGQKESIEFFSRLLPDGSIETKFVADGHGVMGVEWRLRNGRYSQIRSAKRNYLAKCDYEDDNREQLLAETQGHHYDYKMLSPERVGTNDCLVVARIATPEFLELLKDAYYPGHATNSMRRDSVKSIRSEIDTYIRKADGVIIGEVKKNHAGEVMDDELYSEVRINEAIPDLEFALPNMTAATVTNRAQFLRGVSQAKHAPATPISRAIFRLLAAISLGAVIFILYRIFSKR